MKEHGSLKDPEANAAAWQAARGAVTGAARVCPQLPSNLCGENPDLDGS